MDGLLKELLTIQEVHELTEHLERTVNAVSVIVLSPSSLASYRYNPPNAATDVITAKTRIKTCFIIRSLVVYTLIETSYYTTTSNPAATSLTIPSIPAGPQEPSGQHGPLRP